MEISKKSNFRFKALVIGLIATILTSTCGTVLGFSVFNLKPEEELFYNRKVYFTGKTYWRSDGQGRKISLFKRGEIVRKDYGENEGCGIITIIEKREVDYPYYITGEGWISREQIVEGKTTRFLSLDIDKAENGLKAVLHIDGEYVEVNSTNTAVATFEDGVLTAHGDGETTVIIHRGEEKEDIELLVVVAQGQLQLNIPEASMSADLENATITFMDEKVKIEGSGHAEAAIAIDEEGKISLTASGEADAELIVKDKEGNDKELARIDVDGNITALVDIKDLSLNVDAESSQKLTILEKLTIGLREKGHAELDKEHIGADVDGALDVKDNEILGGNAGINYNFGDEDPTGNAGVRVLGNEVYNTGEKTIPVISGLKALIGKIR